MGELQPWQNAISQAKRKFNEINELNLVNFDKEAMFAWQSIQKNDYLMTIANTNPESLRNAVINIAAIGLSLNPAEKLAYLVPRDGMACLDISYIGLIRLATDTGSVMWARAELIHENDVFIYKGATTKAEFSTPNPFNRGKILGVYCEAKTKEGDYLAGIMSLEEVYDIRDRSKAYQNKKGPWVTDEGEMIKKTIIKRESKTWPKTDKTERFDNAIEVINEHEGIDFDGQKILGIRMDQFVDMNEVDKDKVEKLYKQAIEFIEQEEAEHEHAKIIHEQMNQWEEIVFRKLLSKHKLGRKGYHTIFREYVDYIDEDNFIEGEIDDAKSQ